VGAVARRLEPATIVSSELAGEDLINALSHVSAAEYVVVDPDGHLIGVLVTTDVERAVAS
jgi:CBS-domain-containing membrane protein